MTFVNMTFVQAKKGWKQTISELLIHRCRCRCCSGCLFAIYTYIYNVCCLLSVVCSLSPVFVPFVMCVVVFVVVVAFRYFRCDRCLLSSPSSWSPLLSSSLLLLLLLWRSMRWDRWEF